LHFGGPRSFDSPDFVGIAQDFGTRVLSIKHEVSMLIFRLLKIFTVLAFLGLLGCTSTYRVTRNTSQTRKNQITPEEFVRRTGGDQWTLNLVTGQEREATILALSGDSLALVFQGDSMTIPLHEIRSVSNKYYLFGLIVYPISGTLGGAFLGAGVGQATSSPGGWGGLVGFIAGMAIGSVGGLTLGIVNPPTVIYIFPDPEQHP
jgi:hypothetical protein